jgi:hypothetical protein
MQVAEMHRTLDSLQPDFIRGAVYRSAFEPASRDIHTEAERVMISSGRTLGFR